MDAAIAKTTNDELKKLQLKLEILEEQLHQALTRADLAEEQLARYQQAEQHATRVATAPPAPAPAPPPPPPPPPPMPAKALYTAATAVGPFGAAGEDGDAGSFSQHIAAHNLHKGLGDKIIDNVKQQVQVQAATGMSYSYQHSHNPSISPLHTVGVAACVCVRVFVLHFPRNVNTCNNRQDVL